MTLARYIATDSTSRAFEVAICRRLNDLGLISENADPQVAVARVMSEMATDLRMGIIEHSPVLNAEEDTLP